MTCWQREVYLPPEGVTALRRWIVRAATSLGAVITAVVLVAIGGMAGVPTASASTSSVVAWFSGSSDAGLQLCSGPGTFYYKRRSGRGLQSLQRPGVGALFRPRRPQRIGGILHKP